jgi:hypothetical protein
MEAHKKNISHNLGNQVVILEKPFSNIFTWLASGSRSLRGLMQLEQQVARNVKIIDY